MAASAYLYDPFGLLTVENDVLLSKFALATDLSSQMNPKRIMTSSINSFKLPRRLLSLIPHFRDMLCRRQEKVFTAMAMLTTFPASSFTFAACSTATANATELVAVFPKTMKEIPNKHVARNLGRLRR